MKEKTKHTDLNLGFHLQTQNEPLNTFILPNSTIHNTPAALLPLLPFLTMRCVNRSAVKPCLIFLLTVFFCNYPFSNTPTTQSREVPNIIQPVQLNLDTTILILNDYFIDPLKIDSVSFSKNYKGHWNKKENTVQIISGINLPALTELKLWSKGIAVDLLLKRSLKKAYEFTFNAHDNPYQSVQLAGEMNDWNPKKNNFIFQNNLWHTTVELNPGIYQYQLVIDGKWQLDPANKDSANNNNGGFNSVFKTPVNPGKSPCLTTTTFDETSFTFTVENGATDVFVYWQNTRIKVKFAHDASETIRINIPEEARHKTRTWFRIFAYNDGGLANDLLIPLNSGKIISDPKSLDRSDEHAFSIYSILVDRFYDGDSSNDKKVDFKDLKPKANYYGGDLAGITDKLKAGYFDSLHINTLWISPILQNPEGAYKEFPEPHDWYSGYHGYWPISLTKIDPRFGNDDVFKKLVEQAHKMHDNVLIDLVANHVHEECPFIKQHPGWKTQLDLPDGRKNIRLWDEYPLTTWFDAFLPTLDFSKPEVVKLEVDSSLLWITKFGIDGFGHDATKHIPEHFWRSLALNLKKIEQVEHKALYQIGQTYGSKELAGSYIGSGLLDGQFDFNLYIDARTAFANDITGFEKMAATLLQSISFYGSHHLMGNITGYPDQPRIASLAGGGLSFSEDARKAGWERNVAVGSDIAYKKSGCLIAFIATIPGIPVLYYGDEIGMPGAGYPDNLRMMRFGNLSAEELELKAKVAMLFKLRAEHLSFTYGDFKLITAKQNMLAYQRNYFNETTVVVFNYAQQSKWITVKLSSIAISELKAQFGNKFSQNGDTLTVELPAKSFEVFIASGK